ncbi:hypothetical protein GH714_019789 [Hevea brasiliensis]|uniref:Uncharacterized protein n=1 Tax=Hevea brasiliensis TaxID=3981 RepID=A0A6A6MGP5_HEVBR|nr:hypothetical protein GH714_019789 [Hevea brasiliensis]
MKNLRKSNSCESFALAAIGDAVADVAAVEVAAAVVAVEVFVAVAAVEAVAAVAVDAAAVASAGDALLHLLLLTGYLRLKHNHILVPHKY